MPRISYLISVILLLAFTIFYSFYKLAESPPTWFDEGTYLQVAQSVEHLGYQSIQIAPGVQTSTDYYTSGYPLFVPVAASMKLFGDSLLAARVPMAIFIVLCVAVAFMFAYRIFGPHEALLYLLLLATFPLLYGNGKNVLGEVPGMFYVFLTLYFLYEIERNQFKGSWRYIGAGFFIGLAAATKPIFFLFPAAVGIVFLFNIKRIPFEWKNIVFAALSALVPLGIWSYLQFGAGESFSAILFHYSNPYAKAALLPIIVQNFGRFFTEATPLYAAALLGLWVLAAGVRVYSKKRISLTEWAALLFSLLILLAYLRTEGWYRYFFEAMLLALVFLPHSLYTLTSFIKEKYRISLQFCATVLILLLGILQFYQLNFSSWVAEHYQSTQDAQLAAAFADVPLNKKVLIYNAPEIVPFLQSKNYYQYFDIEPSGSMGYGQENIASIKQKVFDQIILPSYYLQQRKALFEGYREDTPILGYQILTKQ